MRARQRSGNALQQEIIFPVGLHFTVASLVTRNEACLNPKEKLFREYSKVARSHFGCAQREKVFRKTRQIQPIGGMAHSEAPGRSDKQGSKR
jgi:hypothetical protein